MSSNNTDPSGALNQRLAVVLNENDTLKIAVRSLTTQLDAAEEIIMRLQSKDSSWESPNEGLAHHLNHQ